MTIQRKYSLPNCTLVLEGLSDNGNSSATDVRPQLSILVNAECHFAGSKEPLTGGRDFFENLLIAVSGYAQEFLSQVHHPEAHRNEPGRVQLHKVDDNRHRLSVQSGGKDHKEVRDSFDTGPINIDLTTVQLFDLVDAVDQFFADSQTLPDLSLKLAPVPKRGGSNQALAKQAVPAAVGMSSLAVAAIAFFYTPIPEVKQPSETSPTSDSSQSTNSPVATEPNQIAASPPQDPAQSSATDLQADLSQAPEITDASQLRVLQRKVYDQINPAWNTRSAVERSLAYRVSVAGDGAIVNYQPITADATDAVNQTPLPQLLYNPAAGRAISQEPIAQFRVVFTNNGVLQVSPWRGYTEKPKVLGPQIIDSAQLSDLNKQVYAQLAEKWEGTGTFPRNLIYRVATTKNGAIADYEPINQVAFDYVTQTPLPSLTKPANAPSSTAAPSPEPLAQFKVVFKPNGVLEVSPWRGYQ